MIVDSSVVVAVLTREPERPELLRMLISQPSYLPAAAYVESGIVLDNRMPTADHHRLDALLEHTDTTIIGLTPEHARIARAAHRSYGKGSGHPAQLNFGDCLSYAVAKASDEPLLFKGEDFAHTDVRDAWAELRG